MNPIQEFLTHSNTLVLDGALGTMLMALGLQSGAPPEEWNVAQPEKLQQVHQAYVAAGSQLILTNSFGGTRFRLQRHNLQDRVTELNQAAAHNARVVADAAPHRVLVGGSMGPTGELLQPMGTMRYPEAVAAFAEQAAALAAGGVDLLWVETMSDLNEVKAAVEGARSVCDLPITATLTFDTRGRTMMGVTPAQAVAELGPLGLAALGANCGNGPAEIEEVVAALHAADPGLTIIAKSNAGIPILGQEGLIYNGTPQVMAAYAQRVRAAGARLIGGCCGNTPDHIAAMASALQITPTVEKLEQAAQLVASTHPGAQIGPSTTHEQMTDTLTERRWG